jgi:hypothetical protein
MSLAGRQLEIVVDPFSADEATRNRLDFVTLRDGGVMLYHAEAVLSKDLEWFRQAGYAVVEFDGAKWGSADVLFGSFAAELRFPSHFGYNLDAFSECLASHEQLLYGRRFMFLLQSVDPRIEFRTVGARPVSWNSREYLSSSRATSRPVTRRVGDHR